MVRAIFVFFCLWAAIALSITQVRHMTGREIWSLTKTLLYSMMCSSIALIVLAGIVILF